MVIRLGNALKTHVILNFPKCGQLSIIQSNSKSQGLSLSKQAYIWIKNKEKINYHSNNNGG